VFVEVVVVALSLRFNGHFSRWARVSRFYWSERRWKWWWYLEP